jgi:RHS repeat-associated protein
MFIGLNTSSPKKIVTLKQDMIVFPEGMTTSGARYNDSRIARWLSVDPLAACPFGNKYPGWSSYVYCINNPLRIIDPNGMEWN